MAKKLVDDKTQYDDWSTRDDIKSQLNMDLIVLLYENGYPHKWKKSIRTSRKLEKNIVIK